MHDINSKSRENALAPNGCNSLPCTVRTNRQRYVIKVLWLGSMNGMGLAQGAWVWSLVVVRMAIVLKYCKTPEKHNITCDRVLLYYLTI